MSRRARPATVACTPSRSSAGSRARGEVPTDFFERITGYAGPTQRYERPARFRLGFRGCGWNKNAGSATVTALFQPHRQGILRQAGAYLISRGRSTLSVRCSRRGDVADALRRPRRTCVFFPPSLASLGEKSRLRRPSDRRARGALEASVRASRRLSIDDLAPNVSLASFARGRCVRRLAEEPAPPALDMRQGFIIDRIAGLGLTSPSPLASPSQDAA